MTGFFKDVPDTIDLPKLSQRMPKKILRGNTGPRGCDDCPRKQLWTTISTPQMEPKGSREADILVLGTSPDITDDREGQPFNGTATKLLRSLIPSRMLDRVVYQNAIRCHATGEATSDVLYSCSVHTEEEVYNRGIKAIIGVGQAPLSLYYPGAQIWKVYGTKFPVKLGNRIVWYYPVFDPAPLVVLAEAQNKKIEYLPHWAVLRADIKKVFREIDDWSKPKVYEFNKDHIQFPDSYADALAIVKTMSEPIGIDWESTSLKPYVKSARMLSAAFSDGITTIAVPVSHSDAPKRWHVDGHKLVQWVMRNRRWVAHQSAMELKWARFFGDGRPYKRGDDTMGQGRLYHEREHGLSLGNLTKIHLGTDVKKLSNLVVTRLDEYPIKEVLIYNAFDAQACRLVHDQLYDKVIGMYKVNYDRLMRAVESTVYMEEIGLPIDLEQAVKFDNEWTEIVAKAAAKIRNLYEVKMYERATGKEFNPGSAPALAEALTKYGGVHLPKNPATGIYRADEETLKAAAPDHPLVNGVLEYRGAVKQKSTYIDPVIAAPILYPDGRIHSSYTTFHTATLRLSAEDPNIQNFPKRRHREIRRMVRAWDKFTKRNHVMIAVDHAQLEVRILAMASKCPALVKFILEGFDMHSYWLNKLLEAYPDYMDVLARRTNETEEIKIRKGGRDAIKVDFVFASFYGSGANSVSARTDIPMHIVEELLEEFWDTFKGVKSWQKARRIEFDETGGVKTLTNRMRHDILPGNECLNTPIQGTGSDIVVDAQNDLYGMAVEMNDMYLAPRINLHDDLTFILPDDDESLEYYLPIIGKTMTKVRYDFQNVPLMAEFKMGKNWADLEDVWEYKGDYVR